MKGNQSFDSEAPTLLYDPEGLTQVLPTSIDSQAETKSEVLESKTPRDRIPETPGNIFFSQIFLALKYFLFFLATISQEIDFCIFQLLLKYLQNLRKSDNIFSLYSSNSLVDIPEFLENLFLWYFL